MIIQGIIILIFLTVLIKINSKTFKCINKKDELYARRVKYLKQKQYDYYYTLAINSPDLLCRKLAANDIEQIEKRNLVFSLYTKTKQ